MKKEDILLKIAALLILLSLIIDGILPQ